MLLITIPAPVAFVAPLERLSPSRDLPPLARGSTSPAAARLALALCPDPHDIVAVG